MSDLDTLYFPQGATPASPRPSSCGFQAFVARAGSAPFSGFGTPTSLSRVGTPYAWTAPPSRNQNSSRPKSRYSSPSSRLRPCSPLPAHKIPSINFRDRESLIHEIEDLKKKVNEQTAVLRSQKTYAAALQVHNRRLEEDIRAFEKCGVYGPRTGSLSRLHARHRGLKTKLRSLHSLREAQQEELFHLRKDMRVTNTKEMEAEKEVFAVEISRLRKVLKRQRNSHYRLSLENQEMLKAGEKRNRLENAILRLESHIAMMSKHVEETCCQISEWQLKAEESDAQAKSAWRKCLPFNEQVSALTELVEKVRSERLDAKKRVNQLEGRIQSLLKERPHWDRSSLANSEWVGSDASLTLSSEWSHSHTEASIYYVDEACQAGEHSARMVKKGNIAIPMLNLDTMAKPVSIDAGQAEDDKGTGHKKHDKLLYETVDSVVNDILNTLSTGGTNFHAIPVSETAYSLQPPDQNKIRDEIAECIQEILSKTKFHNIHVNQIGHDVAECIQETTSSDIIKFHATPVSEAAYSVQLPHKNNIDVHKIRHDIMEETPFFDIMEEIDDGTEVVQIHAEAPATLEDHNVKDSQESFSFDNEGGLSLAMLIAQRARAAMHEHDKDVDIREDRVSGRVTSSKDGDLQSPRKSCCMLFPGETTSTDHATAMMGTTYSVELPDRKKIFLHKVGDEIVQSTVLEEPEVKGEEESLNEEGLSLATLVAQQARAAMYEHDKNLGNQSTESITQPKYRVFQSSGKSCWPSTGDVPTTVHAAPLSKATSGTTYSVQLPDRTNIFIHKIGVEVVQSTILEEPEDKGEDASPSCDNEGGPSLAVLVAQQAKVVIDVNDKDMDDQASRSTPPKEAKIKSLQAPSKSCWMLFDRDQPSKIHATPGTETVYSVQLPNQRNIFLRKTGDEVVESIILEEQESPSSDNEGGLNLATFVDQQARVAMYKHDKHVDKEESQASGSTTQKPCWILCTGAPSSKVRATRVSYSMQLPDRKSIFLHKVGDEIVESTILEESESPSGHNEEGISLATLVAQQARVQGKDMDLEGDQKVGDEIVESAMEEQESPSFDNEGGLNLEMLVSQQARVAMYEHDKDVDKEGGQASRSTTRKPCWILFQSIKGHAAPVSYSMQLPDRKSIFLHKVGDEIVESTILEESESPSGHNEEGICLATLVAQQARVQGKDVDLGRDQASKYAVPPKSTMPLRIVPPRKPSCISRKVRSTPAVETIYSMQLHDQKNIFLHKIGDEVVKSTFFEEVEVIEESHFQNEGGPSLATLVSQQERVVMYEDDQRKGEASGSKTPTKHARTRIFQSTRKPCCM